MGSHRRKVKLVYSAKFEIARNPVIPAISQDAIGVQKIQDT
jgi:hypothetical protein